MRRDKAKYIKKENIRDIFASMIGHEEVPNHIVDKIYEISKGNPLLAEETVKNMADDGLVYRKGGTWFLDVDDLRKIRRPSLLEDTLIEKYESLQGVSLYIVQIAAVIGRRVTLDLLSKISNTHWVNCHRFINRKVNNESTSISH